MGHLTTSKGIVQLIFPNSFFQPRFQNESCMYPGNLARQRVTKASSAGKSSQGGSGEGQSDPPPQQHVEPVGAVVHDPLGPQRVCIIEEIECMPRKELSRRCQLPANKADVLLSYERLAVSDPHDMVKALMMRDALISGLRSDLKKASHSCEGVTLRYLSQLNFVGSTSGFDV